MSRREALETACKMPELAVGLLALALPLLAAPAQWPMYRHDGQMTCRSEGVGEIVTPKLAWRHDLRAWQVEVALTEDRASTGELLLGPFQEPRALSPSEQAAWGVVELVDLAGDGQLVPAPPGAAKILADVPGLQVPDTVMEDNLAGRCVLYAYHGGQRREVWRSEKFSVYQGPHPVVVDANGDGQLDVVACPHYQIVVMDGRTGTTIQQLRWHDGRNYGHFIAKDIDADGLPEFLVLADFYTHMALIDNDGKDLKLLWRKEIELKIENKQKILRPRWDCLQDLDGDGRFEVVTNLYNDAGDRRWHLMVYDALTGHVVRDLAGLFMSGLADADADGKVELFCCETPGLFEPTSARLTILNLSAGEAVERWSYPRGAWALRAQRFPLSINSLTAHADRNVALTDAGNGRHAFYITEPETPEGQGPRLMRFIIDSQGNVTPSWVLTAPPGCPQLQIVGAQTGGTPQTLVRVTMPTAADARLSLAGCTAETVSWTQVPPERATWGNLIAADLDGQGKASVVTVAGGRQVVALEPPAGSGHEPHARWRCRGAGTLAAADCDADGIQEVAMLGWDLSGEGQVIVVEGDGSTLWRTNIPGFPGPLEPWNFSTLTTLAVGRLSGGQHDDLVAFARRSTMHSDEGHALHGSTGQVLWTRANSFDGTATWGFGGTPVALLDTDGDACADIISLYPVNLTIVSGKDGRQLLGRSAAGGGGNPVFPGIWAAYSSPTLFDLDRNGQVEIIWNGQYCLGVTDLTGNQRWAITPAASGFPTDADGDGMYELASPAGNVLRWLDAATGQPKWTLILPGAGRDVAIADINGDRREEALVSCGRVLVAAQVRDGEAALVWQYQAPSTIEEFIVADIDGDEKLEIVLLGGDGWVYGVGG